MNFIAKLMEAWLQNSKSPIGDQNLIQCRLQYVGVIKEILKFDHGWASGAYCVLIYMRVCAKMVGEGATIEWDQYG
jgi:hypothetical protein